MWAGHSRARRGPWASASVRRSAALYTNIAGKPAASSATTCGATTPATTGRLGPASVRGFGPGFGRGFGRGFGPGGFGPGARGGRRGGQGRRGRRGDVRAAILVLLAERPMHGYEMIQEIAERSQDLWRPSPGSVYPTLQLLVDEGLIVGEETEGSKKLFTLTDAGKEVRGEGRDPTVGRDHRGRGPGPSEPAGCCRAVVRRSGAIRPRRQHRAAAAHRRDRQQCPPRDLHDPRRRRRLIVVTRTVGASAFWSPPFASDQDTSTQSSVRCTALRHPAYPAERSSSLHPGVHRLPSCQLVRNSSGPAQKPTASPAA